MTRGELFREKDAFQISSSCKPATLEPSHDDDGLLALETQFNSLLMELAAAQSRGKALESGVETLGECDNPGSDQEATAMTEIILGRLYPIERAIMVTPARTIVGLGVKARHAAHVMSEYWDRPLDEIDWNAQAARLLIEAICNVAQVPPPVRSSEG